MESVALWHILLALAIFSLIIEVFTLGFLAGALGVGLVFSSVGAYLELETEWLVALFALGSVVAFFAIKPIVDRFIKDKVKTNADSIVGLRGRITEAVDNATGAGRALVGGDDWKVESDQDLAVGTQIEVISRESIVLQVKPVQK
jgi:membrane protein implicated in regulation of membrane protease activity